MAFLTPLLRGQGGTALEQPRIRPGTALKLGKTETGTALKLGKTETGTALGATFSILAGKYRLEHIQRD